MSSPSLLCLFHSISLPSISQQLQKCPFPNKAILGKKKPVCVPTHSEADLLAPDSEIDTPLEDDSSEEEVKEGLSGESLEEEETPVPDSAGILEWPTLVNLIVDQFLEKIGPEPESPKKSRIASLGGMTPKSTERKRLPLYSRIKVELEVFLEDVRHPPRKAK